MEELMLRTSVEADPARREVNLTDRDLFNYSVSISRRQI